MTRQVERASSAVVGFVMGFSHPSSRKSATEPGVSKMLEEAACEGRIKDKKKSKGSTLSVSAMYRTITCENAVVKAMAQAKADCLDSKQ